jgi:hypothetical protein
VSEFEKDKVEQIGVRLLESVHDALKGEPVLDKDGNHLGTRHNPAAMRVALDLLKYEGVHARVKPGSKAAEVLSPTEDEFPGFEFPDDPLPQ